MIYYDLGGHLDGHSEAVDVSILMVSDGESGVSGGKFSGRWMITVYPSGVSMGMGLPQ